MANGNIFGYHSSFYYCGLEHLIINMHGYIKDGIDRGEKVYICTNDRIYFKLLEYLNEYSSHVECFDAVEMIACYKKIGLNKIKIKLSKCVEKNMEKGYTGLRFIMQVDYVISRICPEDFLYFDRSISKIVSDIKASFMCIYNFEDYLNNKDFINDSIMKESYRDHFFRLYSGKLKIWNKLLNLK